ncbi:MAG TPA: hypothetical protein VMU09_00730, partial [Acidimicrobiales bacterium]|nr:hypothetical protein [Acidimicrobiales bacterium]
MHRELGADARILNAEKVRNGGYMGFFSREAYRLEVVPADEDTVDAGTGPVAPVPGTDPFAHLAAQADDILEHPSAPVAPTVAPTVAPLPTVPVVHSAPTPAAVPSVATVRDDAPTVEVATPVPEPAAAVLPVETLWSGDVVALVDAAESSANADLVDAESDRVRPSAAMARIAIALAKPLDATEFADPGELHEAEEFAAVLRRVALSDAPGPSVPALVTPVHALSVQDVVVQDVVVQDDPGVGTGASTGVADDDVAFEGELDEIARFLAGHPGPVTEEPGVAHPACHRRAVPETASLARGLRRLGFDDETTRELAADVAAGHDISHLLLERFSAMPDAPPLPRLPGSLLVVAGSGERAFELAAQFAAEIDVDPDAVYVASSSATLRRRLPVNRCVRSTEEAAERAPGWRRSSVAVVAVDAPIAGNASTWARHVIDMLRPTAVWGAVDAVCKTEDVAAWADALGGLDAIVLDSVESSVSPVAVTATG